MYRGGRRGGGRGRGGHQGRYAGHGARQPRIPRRKHYFLTDVTSTSAVLLKPISEELRWKFTQIRAGPWEQESTRYELKLGEERRVQRSVPRHRDNLQDIQRILVQKLREPFEKTRSYQLDCQARLGKLVWLGDLVESWLKDSPGMQLDQFEFERHPYYKTDQTLPLINEYITRATVKDSIMAELERRHGAPDAAHNSLQIRINNIEANGGYYMAIVNKDPLTGKFRLERLSESKGRLAEFASDMVCFGRFHDVRISTRCFQLEQPRASPNMTTIIDSIKLSDRGELQMILKSGPLQVEVIRQREKHVFHVRGERNWQIKYTKIIEHLLSHDQFYEDEAPVQLDIGYDNKELDVILEHTIDQGVNIEEIVEEIMRLIEFSLEIVKVSDKHLDL